MNENFFLVFLQETKWKKSPSNLYGRKDRIIRNNNDRGKNTA